MTEATVTLFFLVMYKPDNININIPTKSFFIKISPYSKKKTKYTGITARLVHEAKASANWGTRLSPMTKR